MSPALLRPNSGFQADLESVSNSNDRDTRKLDGSFTSFVNPTESLGPEDYNLEMVFHNKALLGILGVESTKELHAFLGRNVFVNRNQGNNLSLMTASMNRHSDYVLSQTYKYVRKNDQAFSADGSQNRTNDSNRLISFLRNEVIFNDKKSIVINVRDLTE